MSEPVVQNGMLYHTGDPIAVGSPVWFIWLADVERFRYSGPGGTFGARRERFQRGGWYWKAYRRVAGRLRRAYLGKAEDLTSERLLQAAQQLAELPQTVFSPVVHVPIEPPTEPLMLLATKLRPPVIRQGVELRPDLLVRLDTLLNLRLTIVTAPGGWGKTTLLASWIAQQAPMQHTVVAWVSLDGHDNDPTRLWGYVCAALVAYEPRVADIMGFHSLRAPTPTQLMTLLINMLAERPLTAAPIVFVLDDFHVITHAEIIESIMFLVEHMPARFHMVLAGRSMPTLPLARWRAAGFVGEWHTDDLRLDQQLAATLLSQVSGTNFSEEAVRSIVERTEGWAAGLQLAGLALRAAGPERIRSMLEQFSGSHPYFLDYLVNEILLHEPTGVQQFLLQTSILDRLSVALCDATILSPQDSAAMLQHLERANLFLIPLDAAGDWFRYHHLFADALRVHLLRVQPEHVRELNRRAMEWYASQADQQGMEMLVSAVEHGLQADQPEFVADLIERYHIEIIWQRGEIHTLLGWIAGLPQPTLQQHPELALAEAWGLLATIQFDRVLERLDRIEMHHQAMADRGIAQVIQGELLAIRSFITRIEMDFDLALEQGKQALELLPLERVVTRHLALNNLQNTYLSQGDLRAARLIMQHMQESSQRVSAQPVLITVFGIQLFEADLLLREGQANAAKVLLLQALQTATQRQSGRLAPSGMVAIALAEVCYEQDSLAEAERYARQAIAQGGQWWNQDVLHAGHHALGRIFQARGKATEARQEFAEARALLRSYRFQNIEQLTRLSEAWEALEYGELQFVADVLEERDLALDAPIDPNRFDEYLLYVRYALARQHIEAAREIAAQLKQIATERGYTMRILQSDLLLARIHHAAGNLAQALAVTRSALQLAAPGGLYMAFLREGEPLRQLVAAVLRSYQQAPADHRDLTRRFAQQLLQKFPNNQAILDIPPAELHSLAEALTAREGQVLQLLLHGATNQAIAEQLVVSLHTVKKHLTHIFAKLGVQNRAEAIVLGKALKR